MTMKDIREIEDKTKRELDEVSRFYKFLCSWTSDFLIINIIQNIIAILKKIKILINFIYILM